tara:strand:+ start:192 stop:512 length:321 start_codon:yes stop_codon:yes gene_type:complete
MKLKDNNTNFKINKDFKGIAILNNGHFTTLGNCFKMKNISKEDFILWDTINHEPLEHHDTVYHYTTVVEIINTDGFKLSEGQELRCVAELSLNWQTIISEAIEQTK